MSEKRYSALTALDGDGTVHCLSAAVAGLSATNCERTASAASGTFISVRS